MYWKEKWIWLMEWIIKHYKTRISKENFRKLFTDFYNDTIFNKKINEILPHPDLRCLNYECFLEKITLLDVKNVMTLFELYLKLLIKTRSIDEDELYEY